ncbi:hypothetical protein [Streptomyces sp. NPDC048623]|uniref:hypothetical protein n=1 Tax=Streptomyces sp. NPDC048623 TaxID=3155761 RepID=UPI0034224C6E
MIGVVAADCHDLPRADRGEQPYVVQRLAAAGDLRGSPHRIGAPHLQDVVPVLGRH